MRRDTVVETIRAHRDELDDYGVRSIRLFGSLARDEADAASDVDVLVEFDGPPTFDQYMGLKLHLEELLGVSVDLTTPAGLRDRLRDQIVGEALRVA